MTKNQASAGLYYKTLQIHDVRKMDRSRSKLVHLSEPVKVTDNNKDTCLLAHARHILRQTFG